MVGCVVMCCRGSCASKLGDDKNTSSGRDMARIGLVSIPGAWNRDFKEEPMAEDPIYSKRKVIAG